MGYFKRKKPRNQHSSSSEKENNQFIKPQATLMAIGSKDAAEKEEGNITSHDAGQEKEEAAVGSADAGMEKEESTEQSADASAEKEEGSVPSADANEEKKEEPATSSDGGKEKEKGIESEASMDAIGATSIEKEESNDGTASLTETTAIKQIVESEEPVSGDQPIKRYIPYVGLYSSLESSQDSISSTITHQSAVTNSGAVGASDFGTTGSTLALTNVNISSAGTTHTITADFTHNIWWQVRASAGPSSQVNVASENSAAINASNYTAVAADLAPDASGRATRSNFWSKSITAKHERYHAYNQRQTAWGPTTNTAIQTWLNGQVVPNASAVNNTLLTSALSEGLRVYNALVALPSTENDAYADGRSDYQTLSAAITTKGASGGY